MIINNLAKIMRLKNIKASRMFVETKISRSTISGLSKNSTKMIQIETINTLCNYLGITPNEFFSYTPYNFEMATILESGMFYCSKLDERSYNLFSHPENTVKGSLYITVYNRDTKSEVFDLDFNSNILKDYPGVINTELLKTDDFNRFKNFISENHLTSFIQEIFKKIELSITNELSKNILKSSGADNIEYIYITKNLEPLEFEFDDNGLLLFT